MSSSPVRSQWISPTLHLTDTQMTNGAP
jgi:hypothetical protein